MLLSPVGGNERRSIGDARADTVVFIWGGGGSRMAAVWKDEHTS